MAQTYFGIVTAVGHGLITAALASGSTVNLTHVALGDGGGAAIAPAESMTALVGEVHRAPINTLTQDPESPELMWAEMVLPANVGGWYIREAGVLDEDGNLITVASTPESYKPQLVEGSGSEFVLKLPLVLTNTEAVTLKIDPTVVLASREHVAQRITEHDVDAAAHGDLRALAQAGSDHAQRTDNPHAVTAAQVGASPAAHATDTDNPHGVTAAQLGLGALAALNTVGGAEIRDNAVGLAHLAHGEAGKILGYDGAGAPAALDALPLSKSYVSGSISITTAGTFSLSHGLGETPKLVSCHLLCAVAEHGYATGDIVPIGPHANDTGQGGPFGQSLRVTPSSIYGRFANSGGVINYLRHDTGDSIALTKTSWRLLVSAWA